MNKIVREHYPVERLPEDLRAELGVARTATIVVEADSEQHPQRAERVAEAIEALRRHRATMRPSTDDSVARVHALRDEWDF